MGGRGSRSGLRSQIVKHNIDSYEIRTVIRYTNNEAVKLINDIQHRIQYLVNKPNTIEERNFLKKVNSGVSRAIEQKRYNDEIHSVRSYARTIDDYYTNKSRRGGKK